MKSSTFPRQLARTRRFTAGVPERFTVACDGAVVLFLRSRAGDNPLACLWALDLETGTERLLADPVDLCEVSGHRATGIEAYATDRAARLVTFALAGELWTVNVAARLVRRLPGIGHQAMGTAVTESLLRYQADFLRRHLGGPPR